MSLWNGFLRLLLLGACALGPTLRAQEEPAAVPETPNRVLVLKSGRVVSGPIRSRGNGYDIEQPTGQLFVGSEQVWLIADSLPEAHQMMRDSFRSLTPDVHMQIASWCAANQLWGTARQELLDALHLDPHRDEAKQMLATVIRRQEAATGPSRDGDSMKAVREAIEARAVVLPRRSLGGLPMELVREYTRRIQPLLSNRCASCHDAGSGRSFVFHSVRHGSTPETAEQNLQAILAQLNSSADDGDSFLTMATTRHGTMRVPPLAGRGGDVQKERLTRWLTLVQKYREISVAGREQSGRPRNGVRHAVAHETVKRDSSVVQVGHVVADSNPHLAERTVKEAEDEALTDARRRNRDDPFDAQIFNRRYRIPGMSSDTVAGASRRTP